MSKKNYQRRTEDERIAELEARVAEIKARLEARKQKESPVVREWTKAQRLLRKFCQVALDNGRADLSLSAEAFAAGIERSIHATQNDTTPRRRVRPGRLETDPFDDRS